MQRPLNPILSIGLITPKHNPPGQPFPVPKPTALSHETKEEMVSSLDSIFLFLARHGRTFLLQSKFLHIPLSLPNRCSPSFVDGKLLSCKVNSSAREERKGRRKEGGEEEEEAHEKGRLEARLGNDAWEFHPVQLGREIDGLKRRGY